MFSFKELLTQEHLQIRSGARIGDSLISSFYKSSTQLTDQYIRPLRLFLQAQLSLGLARLNAVSRHIDLSFCLTHLELKLCFMATRQLRYLR